MTDIWDADPPKKKSLMVEKEKSIIERAFNEVMPEVEFVDITDDDIMSSKTSLEEDEGFVDLAPEPPPDLFVPIQKEVPVIHVKKTRPKLNLDLDIEKAEPDIDKSPFKDDDIVISSSLVSEMFYKGNEIEHCARKIHGAYFLGIKTPPTESMEAGNLFESLLLGENRDGKQTTQIRRKVVSQKAKNDALKAGKPVPEAEMRIDEVRIREQVERAKILFYNSKVNVFPGINTQVPVYRVWNGIKIQGHLDLFPTDIVWKGEDCQAIIDVKLTAARASIQVTPYCWLTPNEIDITQPLIYRILLMDIDFSINPYLRKLFQGKEVQMKDDLKFFYFVADYRPGKDKLTGLDNPLWSDFFEVELTPSRIRDTYEVIRKTNVLMELYKENDYPENPEYERCKKCLLNYKNNGSCMKAINNVLI